MTLKTASLFGLIGTVLVTVLLGWDFILNVLNVGRGLVPAVVLFSSLIYAIGALSVAVFFFCFSQIAVVIESVDAPIFQPRVNDHYRKSRARLARWRRNGSSVLICWWPCHAGRGTTTLYRRFNEGA